jgi:integrase
MNWAGTVRDAYGRRVLPEKPFTGFTVRHEENPRRPLLTQDEYERLVAAAPSVSPDMGALLVVANETGHRINSIRLLRWSDVDFPGSAIRWRGEQDKIGYEHVTPMVDAARAALLRQRERAWADGAGSEWVFPAPGDPTQPMSRHLACDWWERTEKAGGLARIPGRGWHSLRRKFATELKSASLKDLCALGGWKDHNTVLKCYQQADPDAMRVALAKRGALRSVGGS